MTKVVNKGELRKEKGDFSYLYSGQAFVKINGTSAMTANFVCFYANILCTNFMQAYIIA
jgi:hypothetical protein